MLRHSVAIGLEKLLKLLFCRPTDPMLAYFWPKKKIQVEVA